MNRYVVLHACGHEWVHDIDRPTQRMRDRAAKRRSQEDCPPCTTDQVQRQVAADSALFARQATERGLPELVGTPGQVQWAVTIRGRLLDSLPAQLADLNRATRGRGGDPFPDGDTALRLAGQVVVRATSAVWWIENRRRLGRALLTAAVLGELRGLGPAGQTARALLMWVDRR